MGDPLRLFAAKDIEAAALYAKRVASDLADLYPVLVDVDGNLMVNVSTGTVTLTSTKVTIDNTVTVTGTVTTSAASTAATINNAVGNPANVSLVNTLVTVHLSPSASLATVSLTSTIVTVAPQAGTAFATTGVTVSLGRSFSSSSGTLSATTGTVLLAGSGKNKVYGFSLTTTSTTGVICSFHTGGIAGTELWRVLLQAPSGANAGANLAVSPPAHIFATASNATLTLNLSVAVRVDFSVAYFDEV